MKYKVGSVIKIHREEPQVFHGEISDTYLHIHSHKKEGKDTILYQLSALYVRDDRKCYERAERWYTEKGLNKLVSKKGSTHAVIKSEDWNGVEAKLLLTGYTQIHGWMWNMS
jgi:hypothetical protein